MYTKVKGLVARRPHSAFVVVRDFAAPSSLVVSANSFGPSVEAVLTLDDNAYQPQL